MAQTYIADVPDGTTNILQDNINGRNNENTLRSNFSGTAFPDTPVAGQHCYRTDEKVEYFYDGTAWIEVAATNTLGLDVAAAKGTLSNLSSRLNVSINPDGTLKDPTTANVDEFKVSNVTPTYVDETTFSVPDDLTGIFTAGRILKITDGAEVKYLSVVSSAFDTVTNVVIDGTITASISAVDYSLAQYGLPKASETVKGVVELATNAEVITGTDTERAVTPAGLLAGFPTRLRSNLLGTVSQTGGVPTGAVIESGSNANGKYVKFANGTLMCYKRVEYTNLDLTSRWYTTETLPISVLSSTDSFVSVSGSCTTVGGLTASQISFNASNSVDFDLYLPSGATTSLTINVHIFVIGRWF